PRTEVRWSALSPTRWRGTRTAAFDSRLLKHLGVVKAPSTNIQAPEKLQFLAGNRWRSSRWSALSPTRWGGDTFIHFRCAPPEASWGQAAPPAERITAERFARYRRSPCRNLSTLPVPWST